MANLWLRALSRWKQSQQWSSYSRLGHQDASEDDDTDQSQYGHGADEREHGR